MLTFFSNVFSVVPQWFLLFCITNSLGVSLKSVVQFLVTLFSFKSTAHFRLLTLTSSPKSPCASTDNCRTLSCALSISWYNYRAHENRKRRFFVKLSGLFYNCLIPKFDHTIHSRSGYILKASKISQFKCPRQQSKNAYVFPCELYILKFISGWTHDWYHQVW